MMRLNQGNFACGIIILFPILFLIVQEYIIKWEEKYLEAEFGQQYMDYRRTVRRWL